MAANRDTVMRRLGLSLPLFLLALAAFAQDDAGEEPADATTAEEPAEAAAAEEAEEDASAEDDLLDLEDPELDVQGFDPTADDDFIPSEDIPADAPIAFPTDI